MNFETTSANNQEKLASREEKLQQAANYRDPGYLSNLSSRLNNARVGAITNMDKQNAILSGVDDFIAKAQAQNRGHKEGSTDKALEAPDPRSALEVRMDYKDAITGLGDQVPEELAALKLRVDSLPKDATEAEKKGPMLAFLKGYEEFRKNLN